MEKNKFFNVRRKVIVILGSTGILGSEYVKYLSKKGAKVIIGDINYSECKKLSQYVNKKYNSNSIPLKVNVYDEESIKNFYNKIIKSTNVIDVVINNFQVKPDGFYNSFEKYTKKTLIKVIEGNTIGVALSCQNACKIFIKQGYGNIINVSSIYGVVAPDQRIYNKSINLYNNSDNFSSPISYGISKSSVINITKYLASYYREKNMRINCITPGGVFDNHDKKFVKNYSEKTLLGRMAKKDEYNQAILFLCSDASSYMTGSNLIIDGGWTAI